MPRTVLITGATGFAGSFLVEHYVREGWQVHGTFRESSEDHAWVPASVRLHQIDLTDATAVSRLIQTARPDIVVHLAAQSSVSASWRDPMGTIDTNIGSQLNLLESLVRHRPDTRVVVVGSCDEYGDVAVESNPITEAQELRPMSPYALSKVAQDLMGYQFFRVHDLPVMRARPFLQLGPRRPDQFVAGSFARQIAEIATGRRRPIIEAGNVDLQRDFSDVRDITRAYALLAQYGEAGAVYNIASGESHSPRDMIEIMMEAAGVRADLVQVADRTRPGEPQLMIGDASKLRATTGWTPERSFTDAVVDTLTYWQQRIDAPLQFGGGPR